MKKVEIEDLLKYRFPSNITMAPDGKTTAFEVAYPDGEKNSYKKDVWLIRNGKAMQLTSGRDTSVICWDDNTHLILGRKTDGSVMTDLYRMSIEGGEAMPWMKIAAPVTKFVKADESHYVFIGMINLADPDAYKASEAELMEKMKSAQKEKDYTVVDEVPYWFNGAGFTNGKRAALFVLDSEKGKVRRVTEPSFMCEGFEIVEDTVVYIGRKFEGKYGLSDYNGLYSCDFAGKHKKTIYGVKDYAFKGVFTLDGRLFVQASDMKAYGLNQTPEVYEVKDGKLTQVVKTSYAFGDSVGKDTMLGKGKSSKAVDRWYVIETVEDRAVLYAYDKDFKETVVYDHGNDVPFFDTDGKKIVFAMSDSSHLFELYEMDTTGKKVKQITHLNEEILKDKYVAVPERIDYESCGLNLHGWALLPEGFNAKKKYPAVLDIHGGPRTVYGTNFFHEMQVWASLGYVVFFTNIKGSDGCGDAFADIRGDYGGVDYQNLMDFTDAVLAKYPNIDQKRVCETGGSYGGFMTNWIITHTDRFCAAASQRSISNWVSFSYISDIGPDFGSDQCGCDGLYGEENIRKMWDRSPLKYAENVKTPTLFIHSDEDYRCPLPEGMQMMQALKVRGVDTRMCIFHGENHELSRGGKPLHRIRRLKEITDWFEKYAK